MEPIVYFLIGMFIIVVGGTISTVLGTIRACHIWDSLMDAGRDTILGLFRR